MDFVGGIRRAGVPVGLALGVAVLGWAGLRLRADAQDSTASAAAALAAGGGAEEAQVDKLDKVELTDAQWRERLTPQQYRILRGKGTEPAFSGKYYDHKEEGTYVCAGCANPLFSSETKFRSGTGWPSFYAPVDPKRVRTQPDKGLFTTRTEVLCARCGGHLGHVFEDGPQPTGLRYCINSVALKFVGEDEASAARPEDAQPE